MFLGEGGEHENGGNFVQCHGFVYCGADAKMVLSYYKDAGGKCVMKKLTTAKIWQFAAGQFGWAMLSGIISNWLVYFYQPDETAISQGQTVFIPQGLVVLGIFTIIGGITAFGRIFDAFTDPMIASWSDRCTSKNGRRIPFLKWASLPLALSTVLVFWSPVNENSWLNAAFLLVMVLAYYLSITAYCTPPIMP